MDKMNRKTAEYRTAEYRRKVFYQFVWIEKDRAKRFLTSTFDIHVIDIRYSQFSTDCFANDDNLQYNLFGFDSSRLGYTNWNRFRPEEVLICPSCRGRSPLHMQIGRQDYPFLPEGRCNLQVLIWVPSAAAHGNPPHRHAWIRWGGREYLLH